MLTFSLCFFITTDRLLSYSDHIPCMVKGNEYDLVYTDITGFRQLYNTRIR